MKNFNMNKNYQIKQIQNISKSPIANFIANENEQYEAYMLT